ncbi:hypothetical protein PV327_003322 [Microctonus hyperodae]|uniref:Uncharacterized protein n=1 Tax=Microctonus hyperodae TaxID=165561 RepID=A0AA39L0S2_MICHY|nr:hypothetical protein PV327_003322 [Microctonus hyperodae]
MYYKIKELGCKNELRIATAFYFYIELCEARRLWDVEYKYEPESDLIYLTVKTCKNTPTNIYISCPSNIKLHDIKDIQNKLNCTCNDGASIFFEINRGMKKPLTSHEIGEKREERKRKLVLKREIKCNSRNLYESAKFNDEKNNYNK